ncbi:MAG: hypothetical protein UV59_C0014G0021 [Candidatus Gottesmanbacteria bacterium GW2011_GWA1_43_11]|uniref:Uncharacterized protein n=1 Tax=Candidatus Gottesmanbacteria bacterium GW2011_GWA1_43_11 TaxID=1618436 RepID=A0A0G1FD42_9BACT|nr:MAG: hypothetical protein UV59_C0014G0021 [Candidatus Gottesmanbacteria bacterium GW2011_GWA1_43_11]
MLADNESLFSRFKDVHDRYIQDCITNKQEFNTVGAEVLEVIRKYENQLVGSTERSQYSKFSTQLSEKFWSGVRQLFPKIDFVGVK